jgi:exopolyphosphatase/guanosine-5'-triphosphate,3'-diphosphate pyrophosphatase
MPDPALYASLDIGTNSVKLTVADLAGGGARRLSDQALVTRLGEGMEAHGNRLREVPMRRTIEAIADFVAQARAVGAREIVAVGTAALRSAENRDDFLRRVQERCGLTIEVISGEEEARLSYLAVRRDPHWRDCARLWVIDIGGGSTEIIQGKAHSEAIASRISVNIGAVRLTERHLRADPPTVAQLAAANQTAMEAFAAVAINTADRFDPDDPASSRVVGVGGTITNLGGMDTEGRLELEAMHGYLLSADTLEAEITRLASLTIAERQQIPGLDPRRADIILGGAILLSQALARLGSPTIAISTRGLRWGVLYDRFL